jgi:isocitrate lyase
MSDEEMRGFPKQTGSLLQLHYLRRPSDRRSREKSSLRPADDGMLPPGCSEFRMVESPTERLRRSRAQPDAALMAASGHTATTKAMGKGSTRFSTSCRLEVSTKVLEEWLERWTRQYGLPGPLRVERDPTPPAQNCRAARRDSVTRRGRQHHLHADSGQARPHHPVGRDQNTSTRRIAKRLMTSTTVPLIATRSGRYVSPPATTYQTQKMKTRSVQRGAR